MKLTDNLYFYIWQGAGNNSNSYLIAGETLTLIDPGMVIDDMRESDAVFASSIGRVDLPGGNLRQLKESVERLSELDVEYLLPGHMDLLKGKDIVQRNFKHIRQIFF